GVDLERVGVVVRELVRALLRDDRPQDDLVRLQFRPAGTLRLRRDFGCHHSPHAWAGVSAGAAGFWLPLRSCSSAALVNSSRFCPSTVYALNWSAGRILTPPMFRADL